MNLPTVGESLVSPTLAQVGVIVMVPSFGFYQMPGELVLEVVQERTRR